MATYNEVLEAIGDYRNVLKQTTHEETGFKFSREGSGVMQSFSAQGGFGAFSTPLSNVHATGVGIRLKKGKVVKNEHVIKVYVFEKLELGSLTPQITTTYKGIHVDIEVLPIQLALAINDPKDQFRPIIGGISISPLNESFVGTLGCFLQRFSGGTKQIFALSNNHVLADTNNLPIGTSIVQPGPEIAPTKPGDIFAALSAFVPIQFPSSRLDPVSNNLDAAIAIITDESLIQPSSLLGINKFQPVVGSARPGMKVIKSGRTTGVTTGIITATKVSGVQINYGTQTFPRIASFDNTIEIISDNDQPFSLPGDSGSVILDAQTGNPVALLFAGDGKNTTACDFGAVCSQFQAYPI